MRVSGLTADGDIYSLALQPRDESKSPSVLRIKVVDRTHMIFLPPMGDASGKTTNIYRCEEMPTTVNRTVSPKALGRITPIVSGSGVLIQILPGWNESDMCDDANLQGSEALQFEIYGPVHFWIFGKLQNPHRVFEFDAIRSIVSVGKNTISMRLHSWHPEHRPTRGDYTLILIEHGSRIEIPELSASFVQCQNELGMHRW